MATVILLLCILLLPPTRAERLPLQDTSLYCCTLLGAPYVLRSSRRRQNGLDGISIEYFALLKERTGLTCHTLELINDPDGVGWSKFIETMAGCTEANGKLRKTYECRCEIGVGGWMESAPRTGVDFLPHHVFDGYHAVVHVDNAKTSMESAFFITAFSGVVWACIGVLALVFMCLKMLDRRFAPCGERRAGVRGFLLKGQVPFRLRRAMQSTMGRMIGQNVKEIEGDGASTRQWVLNYVIVLCGIFLILVYEAAMTAAMVQETFISEFETFQDVIDCKIRDSDLCLPAGDMVEVYWNAVAANSSCRQNGKNGYPRRFSSYRDLIRAAVEKECRYTLVDGGTAMTAVHGRYCGTLMTTGEPFNMGGFAAVVPRGWEGKKVLSRATLELRGHDALDDTMEKYFERSGLCEIVQRPTLDFYKLKTFFIIAFAACGVVLAEMVLDPQTGAEEEGGEEGKAEGEEEGEG